MDHLELARRLCVQAHFHAQLNGGAPCGNHLTMAASLLPLTDPKNRLVLQVLIDAARERGMQVGPRQTVELIPDAVAGYWRVKPEDEHLFYSEDA